MAVETVKGGIKIDHFAGAILDHSGCRKTYSFAPGRRLERSPAAPVWVAR
jgi:hypothetical protein